MSKKLVFAISLVVVGLTIGLLVVSLYTLSGGKASITSLFLALAILLIIIGTVLAFSRLLDKVTSPLMEQISEDIKDDIQDIKAGRMTNTIWMVILVIIGLLAFSFFVLRFHKMEASWGSIPVVIPTFFGLAALGWFIPRTTWFKQSQRYTPMWIFLIPALGFIISLWTGLARTENMRILTGVAGEAVQYNVFQSTSPFIQTVGEVGDFGMHLDLPECDGDGCAVILVIALIILVFILILGSAMIPHFWLFSGSIMLGIMLIIAIHDLRIRPEQVLPT